MQTLQEREAVLRIIAGSCRGRIFEAPKGLSTRPTLDRIKEAVFGSVQFQVPGAVVLDLFSGSGNMGLEAASRGASRVVCVDHDPACAALIRRNGEKLGLIPPVEVLCADYAAALTALKNKGFQADLVFLDAPYASGLSEAAAVCIFREGLLSAEGRVFLEHGFDRPLRLEPGPYVYRKTRRYGTCGITELIWQTQTQEVQE